MTSKRRNKKRPTASSDPRRVSRAGDRTPRPARLTEPSIPGDLPAAFSRLETSTFSIKQSPDGVDVAGRDLVTPLPTTVAINSQTFLFAAIPANPCYWRGTRIAAMAAAYQCYRPLGLKLKYIPQVPVTTTGTVLVGTTWNTPFATESLEQSMVTSNGGGMSQCYVPFETTIRLGSNLQQNLFTCAGSLDEDHNPFVFVALMRGSDLVPGYFFVEYHYSLKNPLGAAVAYDTYYTSAPDYGSVRMDRSVLVLGTVPGLAGPGAILDLEADGECYYNGTLVSIPDGLPVVVYSNNPITVVDPEYVNDTRSIVVLPRAADVGSSVTLQPDRAMWNWETDGNYQSGTFAPTGQTPINFRSTLQTLSIWLENVTSNLRLWIYALDLATNTIGPLLMMARAVASTQAEPTVRLSIATRQSASRSERARRPGVRSPPHEATRGGVPVLTAPPDDGLMPVFGEGKL